MATNPGDNGDNGRQPGLLGRLFGRATSPVESPKPVMEAPTPWWQRLRSGLSRSSTSLSRGLTDIFTKRRLDSAMLDELEDVLIQSDLGVATAERIRKAVASGRFDRDIDPQEVKEVLASEVEAILKPVAQPLLARPSEVVRERRGGTLTFL